MFVGLKGWNQCHGLGDGGSLNFVGVPVLRHLSQTHGRHPDSQTGEKRGSCKVEPLPNSFRSDATLYCGVAGTDRALQNSHQNHTRSCICKLSRRGDEAEVEILSFNSSQRLFETRHLLTRFNSSPIFSQMETWGDDND